MHTKHTPYTGSLSNRAYNQARTNSNNKKCFYWYLPISQDDLAASDSPEEELSLSESAKTKLLNDYAMVLKDHSIASTRISTKTFSPKQVGVG
jgi:hypothetical protein